MSLRGGRRLSASARRWRPATRPGGGGRGAVARARCRGPQGTSWDVLALSALCVQRALVVTSLEALGFGVRTGAFHPGPRCQNASDGASVKGGPSGLGEADPDGAILTDATPMRPSWRVREGSPPCQWRRAPVGRRHGHARGSDAWAPPSRFCVSPRRAHRRVNAPILAATCQRRWVVRVPAGCRSSAAVSLTHSLAAARDR